MVGDWGNGEAEVQKIITFLNEMKEKELHSFPGRVQMYYYIVSYVFFY